MLENEELGVEEVDDVEPTETDETPDPVLDDTVDAPAATEEPEAEAVEAEAEGDQTEDTPSEEVQAFEPEPFSFRMDHQRQTLDGAYVVKTPNDDGTVSEHIVIPRQVMDKEFNSRFTLRADAQRRIRELEAQAGIKSESEQKFKSAIERLESKLVDPDTAAEFLANFDREKELLFTSLDKELLEAERDARQKSEQELQMAGALERFEQYSGELLTEETSKYAQSLGLDLQTEQGQAIQNLIRQNRDRYIEVFQQDGEAVVNGQLVRGRKGDLVLHEDRLQADLGSYRLLAGSTASVSKAEAAAARLQNEVAPKKPPAVPESSGRATEIADPQVKFESKEDFRKWAGGA